MTARQDHPVLRFIRRIPDSGRTGDAPDAQLLARFVAQRDEAAFAGLVQRHGAMVFGVCRRVLGDTPDAEDAFQACFLVLARRGRSVSRAELLGNWLYGVAYRTALRARADAARRLERERQVCRSGVVGPEDEADRRDLRRALDDELGRLPERYRAPLVLCYLEGHTQEEAARRLGCPRKTVTTRLARGCERLRGRLARRGLALPAVSAVLTGEAPAAVPVALLDATIKAATAFAAGEAAAAGAVSAEVAALARGVMTAMLWTKRKTAAALLLAVGVIGTVAGLISSRPLAAGQAEARKEGRQKAAAPKVGPRTEGPRKTDREQLQGSWALVAAEVGGRKASADEVKQIGIKLDFAGDKVVYEQGGASEATTFRLDPAKGPKEIDLVLGKTEVHKCIYRLDGDRLTVCKSHPPRERPTAFASKAGSKWPMLLVFQRAGQSDHAKLQGTWTITASEIEGKPVDKRKGHQFVFAGDKMTVRQPGQENDEATIKLDPLASPKTIDFVVQTGKQKGTTVLAIYALEGDTLKLCLSWDERRPGAFAAPPGRKMQLIVLKRDK